MFQALEKKQLILEVCRRNTVVSTSWEVAWIAWSLVSDHFPYLKLRSFENSAHFPMCFFWWDMTWHDDLARYHALRTSWTRSETGGHGRGANRKTSPHWEKTWRTHQKIERFYVMFAGKQCKSPVFYGKTIHFLLKRTDLNKRKWMVYTNCSSGWCQWYISSGL